MTTTPRVLVVTPTYNERDNLPVLVRQVLARGESYSVLVVDDASPDGTGQIADALGRAQQVAVGVRQQAIRLQCHPPIGASCHRIRSRRNPPPDYCRWINRSDALENVCQRLALLDRDRQNSQHVCLLPPFDDAIAEPTEHAQIA